MIRSALVEFCGPEDGMNHITLWRGNNPKTFACTFKRAMRLRDLLQKKDGQFSPLATASSMGWMWHNIPSFSHLHPELPDIVLRTIQACANICLYGDIFEVPIDPALKIKKGDEEAETRAACSATLLAMANIVAEPHTGVDVCSHCGKDYCDREQRGKTSCEDWEELSTSPGVDSSHDCPTCDTLECEKRYLVKGICDDWVPVSAALYGGSVVEDAADRVVSPTFDNVIVHGPVIQIGPSTVQGVLATRKFRERA